LLSCHLLTSVRRTSPDSQELTIDSNAIKRRRAALGVLATRIDADLVPLVDDSIVATCRGRIASAVRFLTFASDHRCEVTVCSAGPDVVSVEFTPRLQASFDVDMWGSAGLIASGRWSAGRPVMFTKVGAGPVRFVYGQFHRSRPVRRYQTEWIQLP
jgi:hypothetical protein